MRPQPKQNQHRNGKYLTWIRSNHCCRCGHTAGVVAHHVRMFGDGGTGLKPSDYLAVPLCGICHRHLHDGGEKSFWNGSGILESPDPTLVIARLLRDYVWKNVEPDTYRKFMIGVIEELRA